MSFTRQPRMPIKEDKRIEVFQKVFFSMKSETDEGLSTWSNFPERPTEKELASNRPVVPDRIFLRDQQKKN